MATKNTKKRENALNKRKKCTKSAMKRKNLKNTGEKTSLEAGRKNRKISFIKAGRYKLQ